jgi:hypothetical protein
MLIFLIFTRIAAPGTSSRYLPIFGPVTISVKRGCRFLALLLMMFLTFERPEKAE